MSEKAIHGSDPLIDRLVEEQLGEPVRRKRPTNGLMARGLICLDDLRNGERRYCVGCAATFQGSSASTSASVVA
jgi:hypothetical protein